MLSRLVRIQLVIFSIAAVVGIFVMGFSYMQLQTLMGIGRYNVTLDLPDTGGLYRFSNVTYRGVQVGRVTDVELTKTGVRAKMSLDSSTDIPADLSAVVRSVSAVGEQYVDLLPRTDSGPYLHDGSVVRGGADAVPPPIGPMMDRASELVATLPKDKLHQLLDETYKAFNGADYDLQSLADSSGKLVGGLNDQRDKVRDLIENSSPLLDSQVQSTDSLRVWSRGLTGVTSQLVTNDPQLRSLLDHGPGVADDATKLFDKLKITVPVLLANLTTLGQLGVTYRPGLEQALVLLPPVVSTVISYGTTRNAGGLGIGSFRIGAEDPPPCTLGFLPPSSWRPAYDTTTVDLPDDVYCKLPQDAPVGVRGIRNTPCMTKPGKFAPTAEICNSDKEYEPLASRMPVVGPYPRDPSLERQGVPADSRWFPDQGLYAPVGEGPAAGVPPAGPPPNNPVLPPQNPITTPGASGNAGSVPPIPGGDPVEPRPDVPPAAEPGVAPSAFTGGLGYAQYDPRTGEYMAPDGQLYRQADLAAGGGPKTWQDMLTS